MNQNNVIEEIRKWKLPTDHGPITIEQLAQAIFIIHQRDLANEILKQHETRATNGG